MSPVHFLFRQRGLYLAFAMLANKPEQKERQIPLAFSSRTGKGSDVVVKEPLTVPLSGVQASCLEHELPSLTQHLLQCSKDNE